MPANHSPRLSEDKNEPEALVSRRPTDESVSAEAVVEIDGFRVLGISSEDVDFYSGFPADRRKRLVRKIDIRLVPILIILYLIAHIDRANIGNAKIEGLIADLGLTSTQYNIVLALFFPPYMLFSVPSNILLKRFRRPSRYLGTLIVLWGIVVTCTGLVQNFCELAVVRILLGITESGFFPGAVYICSRWYMPNDLASRVSYFYCASALSGAFSGLLAGAIARLDGHGGLHGWRYIFLIEGALTVLLGIACFYLLINSPALSGRWLDHEEIRFLELQTFIKQGGKSQELQEHGAKTWTEMKNVLKNWRIYAQASFVMINTSLGYGIKVTLPTITKAMGYSTAKAQFLSTPPYFAGALSALVCGQLSDRFNWRMPFVAIPCAFILIGCSIMLTLRGAISANVGAAWPALVVLIIGTYPLQPAAQAWNANNIAPAGRRAVGVAMMNAIGNVGGILGSFMYLESQAPGYEAGFGIGLALGAFGILMALLLEWSYIYSNARKAKAISHASTPHDEMRLLAMGDKNPLFKYVL